VAGRLQKVLGSNSKLGSKGNSELKRLEYFINYDSKFETSSHGIGKEKGHSIFNEVENLIFECERVERGE